MPEHGSQEYLWWSQGTRDEAAARNDGLDFRARELRDFIETYARPQRPGKSQKDLATMIMRVFCPDRLKRKYR